MMKSFIRVKHLSLTAFIVFQIQIIITLATGRKNYIWDLMAVRLASLNQTLDPWIYILLRRSLCIKARDLCKQCWSASVVNQKRYDNNMIDGSVHIGNNEQQQQMCVFSRGQKHLSENGCHSGRPDLLEVMAARPERSNNMNNSQLPDVTETGQFPLDCVCQIHIENNKLGDVQDEGIYVKFLILKKDRDQTISSNPPLYFSHRTEVNKSPSHSANIKAVLDKREGSRSDSDPNSTGLSTKETLSTDVIGTHQRSHQRQL